MKVVFVYKEAESIAVEYLSAVLKQHGHDTSLVYESCIFDSEYLNVPAVSRRLKRPSKVAARIAREKPDLVAFSIVSDYYRWACAVARELKTISDVPIVFGGIHVTALPRRTIQNPFVDYAVVGEGEGALLDLAQALDSGGDDTHIANVWCKSNAKIIENAPRPPIADLDSIPFPDKNIFTEQVPVYREIYYVMTSRGCPYSCTYCCNSLLNKMYGGRNFLRKRRVESVIEELVLAAKENPFQMVFFLDDDFLSDREWLEEFIRMYKTDIGTIFRCIGSARHIDNEVAALLADAGCKRIQIGIQTWNENLKRDVCRRYETNEQIVKACNAVKKAGIYLDVDHIFGLPLHEEADYIEAVRHYTRIQPDHINCFWMRYYPGTEIINVARDHNLLSDLDMEAIEEGVERDYFKGGSVRDIRPLARIQALFTLIPFVKPRTVNFLLDSGWYRWLFPSFLFFLVVPRLIQMPFHKDMWYNFRRSLLKFPPFRK